MIIKRKSIMISICSVLMCLFTALSSVYMSNRRVIVSEHGAVVNSCAVNASVSGSLVNLINTNDIQLGIGVTYSNNNYYIDTSFYYSVGTISNDKLGLVVGNTYTYFINVSYFSRDDLFIDCALYFTDGTVVGFGTTTVSLGVSWVQFSVDKEVSFFEIRFVRQPSEGTSFSAICNNLQLYAGAFDSSMAYVNGYNSGYNTGVSSSIGYLGIFSSAWFKVGGANSFGNLPSTSTDITSLSNLPSNYIVPYNSGVYFNGIYGESIQSIVGDYDLYYILADFGANGFTIDKYTMWLLINGKDGVMNSKFEFGTFIKVVFTDNTSAMFNQSDGYFNSIDLSNYVSKRIRFIVFGCSGVDRQIYGMCSNLSYNDAYNRGYNDGSSYGSSIGYDEGFNIGKNVGYNIGYADGLTTGSDYSFLSLISATIDAPIKYFQSLFNFNLLGVNLQSFITALFTLAVIITILKFVLGGGK